MIRQNKIVLVFQSPLLPDNEQYGRHLSRHGDGVKDVAFAVDNIEHVIEQAKSKGGQVVKDIWTESDEHGSVKMAVVQTVNLMIKNFSYENIREHFFSSNISMAIRHTH